MKKILLVLLAPILIVACSKEASLNDLQAVDQEYTSSVPAGYYVPECVNVVEKALLAGQSINVGSITVWNDDVNVYVSYQMTGSYTVRKTHMFIGNCNSIPTNNAGNPRIGQYPYQVDHGTSGVAIYTYTIPMSSFTAGQQICVSAHAEVIAPGFSETGWGDGDQINDGGSWAMKFYYTPQVCEGEGPR